MFKLPKRKHLLQFVWILGIALLPLFVFFSHHQETAMANSLPKVMVTTNQLNVRSLPGLDGQILTEVQKGDVYEVYASDHNWDQIKLTNNKMGWVNATYLRSTTDTVQMGVVSKVKGLNVHQSASLQAKIISHLTTDTIYPLLDQKDGLVEVQSPNGAGWVSAALITQKQIGHPTDSQAATVSAHALTIRQSSSVSSSIVGYLKQNDSVFIEAEQSGWAWIRTQSGETGWVSDHYLKLTPSNQSEAVQTTTTPDSKTSEPSTKVASNSIVTTNSLSGQTIVLDAGHGGKDNGTTGVDGTPEKILTLQTAQAVQEKLEKAGAHVIMTRSGDTYPTLQDRVTLSNQSQADAFISFHYNSSPLHFINGINDFYFNKNRDSRLASDILKGVVQATGRHNRGTHFDNLYVLRNNTQPSTLIELGFLSNKAEDAAVHNATYQGEVADGVYQGLLNYFSGQ